MNPYCTATWISSKLAWSVQAEAPCAELLVNHEAGESQELLLCLSLLLKGGQIPLG